MSKIEEYVSIQLKIIRSDFSFDIFKSLTHLLLANVRIHIIIRMG